MGASQSKQPVSMGAGYAGHASYPIPRGNAQAVNREHHLPLSGIGRRAFNVFKGIVSRYHVNEADAHEMYENRNWFGQRQAPRTNYYGAPVQHGRQPVNPRLERYDGRVYADFPKVSARHPHPSGHVGEHPLSEVPMAYFPQPALAHTAAGVRRQRR